MDSGSGDGSIKNLSIIINLAKFKKLDFIKAKSFETDFFIFRAKETFIYLQKAFIKALIFRYFDPKYHIQIKTDGLRYVIDRVLS